MKKLIINADDMGVSKAINDAVIELYRTSSITGTSVISPGESFLEACLALKNGGIREVGVHLTLTGKFRPVTLDSKKVEGFLSKEGYFPESYVILASRLFLEKINRTALREELGAQIEKVKREGFSITHLDSHEHVHILPWVIDTALELCAEFSIPYIRIPIEPTCISSISFNAKDLIRHKALRLFSKMAYKKIPKFYLCSNSDFFGHFHSGRLDQGILLSMVENIREGITELAVHPSFNSPEFLREFPWYGNGQKEMEILMSVDWKNKLRSLGITLAAHSGVSETAVS